MPNFCPNCAAQLDPDAKFCPSCSSPIAYAGGGGGGGGYAGGGYGGGMGAGQQRAAFPGSSLKVDSVTWTGMISLFWALWFLSSALSGRGIGDAMAGRGVTETQVIFSMIGGAFSVVEAAFQITIAYGVFNRKRWVYPLFMITVGPLALVWLVLALVTFLAPGTMPAGIVVVYILGLVAGLGLIGLQTMLIMKNKHQFTNG